MRSKRQIVLWAGALGIVLAAAPGSPPALAAQNNRLTVLVAPVAVTEPVDRRFGERIAEEVRDALETFPGYIAIERGDARKLIDQFDLDERAMQPIEWRQLGMQMDAAIVMVGTAVSSASGVDVDVVFMEPTTGDQLPMEVFSVADDRSHEEAAIQIMEQFGQGVEYYRSLSFCADYVSSEEPEDAINNCTRALSLSPDSDRAYYLRGRAHMLNEAWGDAVSDLQRVVDRNESDTNALQSLAYSHAQLGNGAESLRYYREFLGFQPDAVDVRRTVAYELMQASSWAEAVALLQEGVDRAPDNLDLLNYLLIASLEAGQSEGEVTDPEMIRLAVDVSDRLVAIQGDAVEPTVLSNATNAHLLLDEFDEALSFSQRALDAISNSAEDNGDGGASRSSLLAQVHSLRAEIYDHLEDPANGISELERALDYDPDIVNGRQRLGDLKLKSGDATGAVEQFRMAVSDGANGEQIAQALLYQAHQQHITPQQQRSPESIDIGEVSRAVELLGLAAEFASSQEFSEQIYFFTAYSHYLVGSGYDGRNSADEECGPARNALAAFRQVAGALANAGSFQQTSQQDILNAVDAQVFRQESIIESACQAS